MSNWFPEPRPDGAIQAFRWEDGYPEQPPPVPDWWPALQEAIRSGI